MSMNVSFVRVTVFEAEPNFPRKSLGKATVVFNKFVHFSIQSHNNNNNPIEIDDNIDH